MLTVVRRVILVVVLAFVVFLGGNRAVYFLRHSGYFAIREVLYHPSLKFMASEQTPNFKGRNLFALDLQKTQRQLQMHYPQIMNLRVVKRFPGQLLIIAKQRIPFAQMQIRNQTVILDEDGIILSAGSALDGQLPFVTGIRFFQGRIIPGLQIKSRALDLALKVIEAIKDNDQLSALSVKSVDVGNASQIYFTIDDNLKIIIDQENIDHKLELLALIFSKAKAELEGVKYIDLRFKEPILGKK